MHNIICRNTKVEDAEQSSVNFACIAWPVTICIYGVVWIEELFHKW